jgi:hypothetical protein
MVAKVFDWMERSLVWNLGWIVLDCVLMLLALLAGKMTVGLGVLWALILYVGCYNLVRALELRREPEC